MNELDLHQVNKYNLFGISKTIYGNTLKLGTLFPSGGNLNSIKKNIEKQIKSRLSKFNLEFIYCIKMCVPNKNPNSEQAIKEVIDTIFPNNKEYFIDKKDNFPKLYFIKIIFDKVIQNERILNLGKFFESSGSDTNIKKNITQQFDKLMLNNKYTEKIDNFDMIEFR